VTDCSCIRSPGNPARAVRGRLESTRASMEMTCPHKGPRILLLEDDALISIDIQEMLLSVGARQVMVANTLEEAEAILEAGSVDAVVLDLLIGRDRCDGLASRLVQLGMPVVLASGFYDPSGLPEELRRVPSVQKPCSPGTLEAALGLALGKGTLPAKCR
jgi:DNA-binding NtrC family response regulator